MAMPAVPPVLLIDPDEAAREEVRRLLSVSGLAVTAHAGYGPEALRLLQETSPSLVVMALRGIPQRALIMLEQVRALAPGTPVVLYGMPSLAAEAMALGARACLSDRPGEALVEAARRVLAVEEALRRRAGEAAAGGMTLAVVSARGGVGKTTVAAGLAAAFAARLGLSTVLVDCDPYGGAAGLLPREKGAPATLPASALEEAPQLAARHDFVVIDTAAGLREEALQALEVCDLALLVTTPEVGVLREHARALEQLAGWGFPADRLLLVLDRTHPSHRASAAEVAQALDRPLTADIPYDRQLRRLAEEGITPVLGASSSPAARALVALACRLAGVDGPGAQRHSLMHRLRSLLWRGRRG
jgi:MinD-like ATPase involved in chromosome partitioning or flagellar assembly/CheY-like chemotaxis protein